MIVVGLTGSIGTGKSTTSAMFRELGIPVHDADDTVHALYGGKAVGPIGRSFPDAVKNGVVDRKALSAILADHPERFSELEAIVHPLVRQEEQAFITRERTSGSKIAVLDVPLLFETGGENRVDKVVVVTCDPEIQRQRVLARPNMTPEKFELVLSRQMPDAEKRRRADFVVDTGKGLEAARQQVEDIVETLAGRRG
ncbi:dephospho-CoA kinase [Sinorhizobium sp. BG8]|uniref:dephospho-CoA kinase n=1 Tax=Sinorhizobium sp. BG8 TaxID=2613773 RepID=UPI00193D88C7|nr:dephospho-CoA kinase [Sinorhizobium sp. BG8]QRM53639.1 dephospho-CoA kinase [Sinorhizobium sp. BG8]